MDQRGGVPDAQTTRMLDALNITPQHFLDFKRGLGQHAVSTVDTITPALIRPSRTRWPFTEAWHINLETFDKGLRTTLDPRVGYCYMIRRKGTLVHFRSSGWAQMPKDGDVGWFHHIPMNVASVSKFVTAIALVRLLREAGIPVTAPIVTFLPQYWNRHESIGAVTFHQLLRHEAGLGTTITDEGAGDFAEAKREISMGSSASSKGKFLYKNVNFAILRVLFATVTTTLSPSSTAPSSLSVLGIDDDVFWDFVSATTYSKVVNEGVFAPANIDARQFEADPSAAKGYATPPVAPGEVIEDGAGRSGQTGWHLTINELVRLLDEFRAGSMMARWRAQQLLSNMYGLDPPLMTQAGPVYRKGGRKEIKGKGMDSAIYLMPDDVDFAIFVNSFQKVSHLDAIPTLIKNSVEFTLFSLFGATGP